jgi:hypothetical protein
MKNKVWQNNTGGTRVLIEAESVANIVLTGRSRSRGQVYSLDKKFHIAQHIPVSDVRLPLLANQHYAERGLSTCREEEHLWF